MKKYKVKIKNQEVMSEEVDWSSLLLPETQEENKEFSENYRDYLEPSSHEPSFRKKKNVSTNISTSSGIFGMPDNHNISEYYNYSNAGEGDKGYSYEVDFDNDTIDMISLHNSIDPLSGADLSSKAVYDNSEVVIYNDPVGEINNEYVGLGVDSDNRLLGTKGDDVLVGGSGNDILIGGDGDDVLIGGDGDDILIAGDGNDLLVVDQGNNQLYGGAGIDTADMSRVSLDENTLRKISQFIDLYKYYEAENSYTFTLHEVERFSIATDNSDETTIIDDVELVTVSREDGDKILGQVELNSDTELSEDFDPPIDTGLF
ncbi:MAG: calcium-binding protein [Pseudomonadota bacterium]